MEILLFIILLILVLVLTAINLFLFYKMQFKEELKKVEKQPKLTREEKEKQKKIKESFDNLMRYDENLARKSRK